ncbi:HNH endonuclease family protein [Microbacterium elymi]|uniref:HNH endonuclease family protein n=1 Tax=Microbacterium elymi TaxID=2909587 RepID=A0ABY5NH80_9MICO|nr:HNH endonuclease family protein [Microbacterium elymi]UUT34535.1 HNH endonuclease family protein [Microbacterium elymi]
MPGKAALSRLSQTRREALANDPLNLLAVDGPSNAQKGAGNAATWLPKAKGYRCAYVARQITVKADYDLWVTPPERDAMTRILQTCPQQKAATAGTITLMPDAVGTAPAPKPAAPKPAAPKTVHPGSFCAPIGAHGVTTKGTPMVCSVKAGQTRARWRSG